MDLTQTEYNGMIKEQKQEIDNLTNTENFNEINPLNYSNELLKCISQIKISNDSIYIKLNKNLILHSQNQISICDNLNIQIAGQIHLNPVVKLFRKIQSKFKKLSHDLPDLG